VYAEYKVISNAIQSYFQDGYKLKVNKIEPCDSSNQIKLTNPKVELTKNCELFVQGCGELTSGFTSCKVCFSWVGDYSNTV
jgi:hypothetical protein